MLVVAVSHSVTKGGDSVCPSVHLGVDCANWVFNIFVYRLGQC